MGFDYSYPLTSKTYYYHGILVNETPIRIGSSKGIGEEIDMPIIYSNGKPFIPATSLKGALRTEAEKFVLLENKYDVYFPDELTRIIDKKSDLSKIKRCPTCILFGAPHLLSRLTVYDSYVIGSYHVSVRTLTSINRITGAQKYHSLFNMEYVEPGAKFEFRMNVRGIKQPGNDDDIESYMGKIVDHLINVLKSGELQLGSKKSNGFGRVVLQDVKIEER